MDSFFQIGKQGSANITVVAPGIAEALLATMAGLLVAIPASVGYNAFAGYNRDAESRLAAFASELLCLFTRADMDILESAPPIERDCSVEAREGFLKSPHASQHVATLEMRVGV